MLLLIEGGPLEGSPMDMLEKLEQLEKEHPFYVLRILSDMGSLLNQR